MTLHEIEAAIRQIGEVFDASDASCVGGFVAGIYVVRLLVERDPSNPLSMQRDEWVVWAGTDRRPRTLAAKVGGNVRHVADAVMATAGIH